MGQEMSLIDEESFPEDPQLHSIRLVVNLEETLEAKLQRICRPNLDKATDPSAPRFL
jgi:hypothetical protein